MTADEWRTYGVNETEEGLTSVEEGDELRLKLSWMTEASGHESGKADVVVTEVDEDEERVYIEDKNERIRTLPRGGTWYTDMHGTAYREESPHYAYSIDWMKVRLTDDEQQELATDGGGLRKYMRLIVDHEKHPEHNGLVQAQENRPIKPKKNESAEIMVRNRETGEEHTVEMVGLGYYDFEDEEHYEEAFTEVAKSKLREIDAEYLRAAGLDDLAEEVAV
jgi:hypothetical protein